MRECRGTLDLETKFFSYSISYYKSDFTDALIYSYYIKKYISFEVRLKNERGFFVHIKYL